MVRYLNIMGNLMCCKKCKSTTAKKKIVLLLVGLDGAGKTTTVKGLSGEVRHSVVPTVGFSVVQLKYRGCDVHIYDVGGGPQIRGIWHLYYADAHGIIFVVDSSDYRRLSEVRLTLNELLKHEKLTGKPMLLLANKQDVIGSLDELDIVEKLELEDLVNQQRCPTLVKTCSALEDSNTTKLDDSIFKGYAWLLNLIVRDYWKINARVEHDLREQETKYTQARKELLNRLHKTDRRNTANSIEWLTGGTGDRVSPIDSYRSTESNSSSPVVFDNVSSRLSPIVTIHNPVPYDVELKTKRFFPRTNKTAPATLFGVNSLDRTTPERRLKSAQPMVGLTLDASKLETNVPLSLFTKSNGTVPRKVDPTANGDAVSL